METKSPKLLGVAPVLLVADLQASAAYWRDKVGFDVSVQHGDPVTLVMPKRDNLYVMLFQTPEGTTPPAPNWQIAGATNNIYFWVDDAAVLYEELISRGAIIDYTLYDTPWGTREFGIQDLDDRDITFGQLLRD